ncbi:MAG: hypothetical protein WED10_05840 [Brumimicrobium sp.]
MNTISKLLIFLAAFTSQFACSQFFVENGKEVTTCDCNSRLDELDLKIDLPDGLNEYDIIYFAIYDDKKELLSYKKYRVSAVINKSSMSFNLLNPAQEGSQVLLTGEEYGLFQGEDFTTSYNKLCEKSTDQREIYMSVTGVKQVGTETEYTYDESRDAITGESRALYDNGTFLKKSESLTLIPRKDVKNTMYKISAYAMHGVTLAVGAGVFLLMNTVF